MEHHIDCFRGSQNNVLERFYLCSKCYCGELIIRLTADNIFVDAQIIDAGIQYFRGQLNLDYLYYREGLPLGTAVELFTADALARTYQEAGDSECLEHVTLYMYRNPELFECQRAERQEKDYSHIRLTMDTEQDCQLVKELYKRLLKNDVVLLKDAIKEIECDEKLKRINENIEQVIPQYGK
jgi:spore coat polysaccharide biosynthesis protein SpsF